MKFAATHTRILMPQCHRLIYIRPNRPIQPWRFFRDVKIVKWLAQYLRHNPSRRVLSNEIGGNNEIGGDDEIGDDDEIGGNKKIDEKDKSDIDDNNKSDKGGSNEFQSEGG